MFAETGLRVPDEPLGLFNGLLARSFSVAHYSSPELFELDASKQGVLGTFEHRQPQFFSSTTVRQRLSLIAPCQRPSRRFGPQPALLLLRISESEAAGRPLALVMGCALCDLISGRLPGLRATSGSLDSDMITQGAASMLLTSGKRLK